MSITESGQNGSPIILLENNELGFSIIAIHKGANFKKSPKISIARMLTYELIKLFQREAISMGVEAFILSLCKLYRLAVNIDHFHSEYIDFKMECRKYITVIPDLGWKEAQAYWKEILF
jgi:hypothetical protein